MKIIIAIAIFKISCITYQACVKFIIFILFHILTTADCKIDIYTDGVINSPVSQMKT